MKKSNITAAGFTLLELIVVLTILALLSSIVGPKLVGYLDRAKSKTAQVQINALLSSLDLYRVDVGSYPTRPQGLHALLDNPYTNSNQWRGPYIDKETALLDPWGAPYFYREPTGRHRFFDLGTFGADGVSEGEQDNADIIEGR